jgi:radical SAM protein
MARFDDRPFIAIWETTQACDLACAHCRACAQPERDRDELDTGEAKRLLDRFAEAHVPLVILTGGDPAKRPDLLELVEHGAKRGLVMGLTPSATPLVTPELVQELARAGLSRLAISIDASGPALHDSFRGVDGSFTHSLRILQAARAAGISTQINTSVHAGNIAALGDMVPLVRETGVALWSVFFIVPTGRAAERMLPTPEAVESALELLADTAEREHFSIKTTAAPHYRRVLSQRKKETGHAPEHGTRGKQGFRVNDGRGFLFVSHRGDVFPSGFLPVKCGNVRERDVIEIYRDHPTFRTLRDPEQLRGKCGACEYKQICSGSRARAFAMTGDLAEWDSLCAYVPPGYEAEHEQAERERALRP